MTRVEYTETFESWWDGLSMHEQEDVAVVVDLLQERGPHLGFPFSSQVKGARHSHMRELRIQHKGQPYRVLYAFDTKRHAILLLGGRKVGSERWYDIHVPLADRRYDEHLDSLRREEA
jgi:hypothetical protein